MDRISSKQDAAGSVMFGHQQMQTAIRDLVAAGVTRLGAAKGAVQAAE